ncbi:orotate phosphoribosyltransferase [Dethiosulfovibrio peptidovorans DSM 11002]|uniref:Orotate phosphoribosyltransferase n=1 Tax=Dethiosulfovibrio peptidovorans DSM 11002 TaxID=469381 RepID=D2Z458_9BACT|nr:orotate phosphoribosyltransferase [Dethiosulfovibrio peptidovorans]EFC92319.1 orotate phosphoribosyltransferase [Dethiosulfovibrio peptidovorans DSM 11002]
MSQIRDKLEELMLESEAYLKGHFLLTSGKHSGHYMQCAMMLRFPDNADFAGRSIAESLKGKSIDFVASPAIGGLIIGHEVAKALGVPFIFCERENGKMSLRRFPVPVGERFVVVEDVITTGGSAAEVGRCLSEAGCEWVDTACIVDRSGGKHCFDKDPLSLWKVSFPVYDPDECPLCSDGSKPYKPGSR